MLRLVKLFIVTHHFQLGTGDKNVLISPATLLYLKYLLARLRLNLQYKVCLFLLLIPLYTSAKINVGADEWHDFTHSNGSGIYLALLKEIYGDDELAVSISAFARMKSQFNRNELDILLGVYPEDIPEKLLPQWPLDREAPIVAFYDSRKLNVNHISDIEKINVSWVRGYDFDRFVPTPKSTYDVNHPSTGFKLLLNGRIDAFIDYNYNKPKQLPDYIKSFQVMPARNIYAAFQKNVQGKALAAQFDEKMEELKRSGKLAEIFGEYYPSTGFETHESFSTSVTIYTDERDLLGNHQSDLNKFQSSLYNVTMLLKEQLPNYQFTYKKMGHLDNALQAKDSSLLCALNAIKTPTRAKLFNFSQAISLYQGLRLFSTVDLKTDSSIDLSQLLQQQPELLIGQHSGRSYGSNLDKVFQAFNKHQVVQTSNEEITPLKQLSKGRFNLIVESPVLFNGYWSQISKDAPIFNYTLQYTAPFITGHIACQKTGLSEQFIIEVDAALRQMYGTGIFYNVQKALVEEAEYPAFAKVYRQYFENPNKH